MRTSSGSEYLVIGPTVEMRLPFGLAVEADGLYRPVQLRVQQETSLASFLLGNLSTTVLLSSRIDTWEFPILAKYRLPVPLIKPYIEAGPAFRAVSTLPAKLMSGHGVAAGIGVEFHIGGLQISPEIRYTHWGNEGNYQTEYHGVSYPNQVEVLAGFTKTPGGALSTRSSVSGLQKYLSVGVKGGLPFSNAFVFGSYSRVTYPNTRCCVASTATIQTYDASRNYLAGPTVEVHLPFGVSVEGDGLYGPLSWTGSSTIAGLHGLQVEPLKEQFAAWQFPVVAKYTFRAPFVSPYLEAGPTFRTMSSVISPYLSNTGVTAGLGAAAIGWRVRLSAEVRFVHWGNDAADTPVLYPSRRNQAQFLVGLAY